MFEFIKKLFAKEEPEEREEESIKLAELNSWFNVKAEDVHNSLNEEIIQVKGKIKDEMGKAKTNLSTLKDAELKNPNIPLRAKQMMEGNRVSYVKIISNFLDNVWEEVKDEKSYEKLLGFSNNFDNSLDILGKSTTRSYHVIREFFANEATNIAINIKNVDGFFKELKSAIEDSNIAKVDAIKKDIEGIKNKINQKTNLEEQLKNKEGELGKLEGEREVVLKEATDVKNSEEYLSFNKLKEEREKAERDVRLNKEDVFSSFSVVDKALKKYLRVAFEDEKLLSRYIEKPINALLGDDEFKIIKILESLEKNLVQDKIELDEKKKNKTLAEIKKMNKEFFNGFLGRYKELKGKLEVIEDKIDSSEVKNKYKELNERLSRVDVDLDKTKSMIGILKRGMEKIDIEKIKNNLQKSINHALKANVLIE